ncbi:MAG: hypothetical protein ABIK76_04605 [candidate division WOR-3 bacterium]
MRKFNKLPQENAIFKAPQLPKEELGIVGLRFHEAIFDLNIGPEFCLVIFEKHEYSKLLARIKEFSLFCKAGVARTSHGIISFLIFIIYNNGKYFSSYELILNPYKIETFQLLSSLSQQTHLKLIIYDSEKNLLQRIVEFENNFGFSDIAQKLAQTIDNKNEGDFQKAQQEFMITYSIKDLLNI